MRPSPKLLTAHRLAVRVLERATQRVQSVATRRAPRVLIYTDSRGLDLRHAFGKSVLGTYGLKLGWKYDVTLVPCPESHTTIVDFLEYWRGTPGKFDAVVLHCGIVDFSPRPLSNVKKVQRGKAGRPAFDALFEANAAYYARPFPTLYEGEETVNLYSPEYLREQVIPALREVPNLVWISSNAFVPGWEGNYTRGRPANIATVVDRFDRVMRSEVGGVNLDWTADEVQAFTIDNIHFTPRGFKVLTSLLEEQLDIRMHRVRALDSSSPQSQESSSGRVTR